MAPTLGNGSVWRSVDRRTRPVTGNYHVSLKPAWPPCSVSPWPNDSSAQLLGQHLLGGSGAAILVGPAPLLEPTHDHDTAAPAQRLDGMLGLVAPHDHGVERRLLLRRPDAATQSTAPGAPALGLGVADLGSSLRLPAKLTLASVMVLSSCCLAGRSARSRGAEDRWIPWHGPSKGWRCPVSATLPLGLAVA